MELSEAAETGIPAEVTAGAEGEAFVISDGAGTGASGEMGWLLSGAAGAGAAGAD
jgi:hypothetical protein